MLQTLATIMMITGTIGLLIGLLRILEDDQP